MPGDLPGHDGDTRDHRMRTFLDRLYGYALWLAALCLAVIGVLVGAQLAGRLVDGALKLVGLPPLGFVVLSLAEFAGFLLAASSFLALAGTLKSGTHIRVTMVLSPLGDRARRWIEVWALGFSAALTLYATAYIGRFAYQSWSFDEVSPGVIPVLLWIPQAAMVVGALVLAVALVDELVIVLRGGRPSFRAAEDAITLGKEG